MNNNKRIIGLDVLRSIAIILVMLMHSGSMFLPLAKLPLLGNIVGKLLAIIIPVGYLGVELFFVLSGYLIGSILIKLFSDNKKPIFKEIKQFWIRRWLRTLPNYYFVLLIKQVIKFFFIGAIGLQYCNYCRLLIFYCQLLCLYVLYYLKRVVQNF